MENVRKRLIFLLALVMVTAVILTGCKAAKQEDAWEEMEQMSAQDEPVGIPVENDYMTFRYPREWEGKVETVRTEENGNLRVAFQTEISGQPVELFAVVMGPALPNGFVLGHLDDPKAGTIYVTSIMNEVSPEDWSEEDYKEICSLQERVNDIIVQFHGDGRFVPAQ